jgi:hypothetical protein
MVRKISDSQEWSLILVRSGGYTIDNELNDALFHFGRTFKEIMLLKKNNLKPNSLPNAVTYLLKKNLLSDVALETGFIIDISKKEKHNDINYQWIKFEKIISSCKSRNTPMGIDECLWGVYSLDNGNMSFEMIGITPETLPTNLWIKVRPLSDRNLAWILSQNNLLKSDEKEQKTLDDFFECNLPELHKSFITLPGPP